MMGDAMLITMARLKTPTAATTSRVGVFLPSSYMRVAPLAWFRETATPRSPLLLGDLLFSTPVCHLRVVERTWRAIVDRVLMRSGQGERRQGRMGGSASVRPALTRAAPYAAVISVVTTITVTSITLLTAGTRRYTVVP